MRCKDLVVPKRHGGLRRAPCWGLQGAVRYGVLASTCQFERGCAVQGPGGAQVAWWFEASALLGVARGCAAVPGVFMYVAYCWAARSRSVS